MIKTQNRLRFFKTASLTAALFCAFILPTKSHAQADITTGLVGHWKLDETSGTTVSDSSSLGNDGSYMNGLSPATHSENGAINAALNFENSGTHYISIPDNTTYQNLSAFTMSAWIKPYNFSNHMGIMEVENLGMLWFNFNTNRFQFTAEAWDTTDGIWRLDNAVQQNEWAHIAITYDYNEPVGTDPQIYINGTQLTHTGKQAPAGTYTPPGYAEILIGSMTFSGLRNFHGAVDDARLYNRALTAEDIEFLYYARPGNIRFNSDNDTVQYFDDDSWVASGPPKYKPNAVAIREAAPTYLSLATDLTGVTDTKIMTGSFWYRSDNAKDQQLTHDPLDGPYVFSNGDLRFNAYNPSSTQVLRADTTGTNLNDGNWHHILYSFDLSNTSNRHVYVDGVAQSPSYFIYTDDFIDHTNGTYSISQAGGISRLDSDLADLWIDFDTYIDLSVEENRLAFIDAAGNPVDLGEDGSKPTGTAPDIFLSGDTDDWHTNKGTGGGFTENGVLTTVPSPREDNYTWQQIGNSYDAPGGGDTSIAVLSPNSIAIFHDNNTTGGSLTKAVFDGTNFTQVGNTLIVGGNNNTISELDNDTIVLANGSLTAYFFNGSDWVQVGNSSTGLGEHVTTLSENRIAAGTANTLRTFTWDGTNFTPVGNQRTIINLGRGNLVGLSENRVAAVSQSNGIQAYEFDGTDWIELGNPLPVTLGRTGGTSFDENTLIVTGESLDLTTYRFNGSDWLPYGQTLDITGNEIGAAVISRNTVAINRAGGPLNAFGFAYCSTPLKPQGSIIYESTNNQMQYCDGENWVPMGAAGDGGGGCSTPTGAVGDITYNQTYNLMQYCEGDTWVPIGQGPDPCDASLTPDAGTRCRDGSIYAGLSPDGNVPMFVTAEDAPGTYTWNNGNSTGRTLTGISSTDPTGEANTALLVTLDSDSITAGTQPHVAAQYCYDLVAHGKSDWYLPSRPELGNIQVNAGAAANIVVGTGYWSSSERTQDTADRRTWDGTTASTGHNAKDSSFFLVRCARKD